MLKRVLVPLLIVVMLSVGTGYARQDQPTALISRALADLSTRAGRTITLDDLTSWSWQQANYPDTSLGCPQSGQSYAQVVTNGYRFLFVYSGATFDYRASADGTVLFLCSGPATVPGAPTTVPTGSAVIAPAATEVGRAVCPGAMNSRLAVGMQGRVRPDGLPVNIRSAASSTSPQVGQMAPGNPFNVLGGPECGQNFVWWQIGYGAITGWAAEGANGVYWIEPVGGAVPATAIPLATAASTPAASPVLEAAHILNLPTENTPISSTNAELDRLVELPISEQVTAVAWSSDGQLIAASSQSGIRLYSMTALRQLPRLFQVPNGPTLSAAFSPDGSLLVTGHNDTIVRLWDITTGGLRGLLRGHMQPVWAVAFSPDGRLVASASGNPATNEDSTVRLWDVPTRTQIAVLQGHSGAVTSVAFSPDGKLLASGSTDNSVRLWDVASASPGTVLPSHAQAVRAVAFSPDGSWLASAGDDGLIGLWEIGPGQQITLDNTSPVLTLAFSPDGSLLAAAGGPLAGTGDNRVRLWDLSTSTLIATLDSYDGPPDAVVTGLNFNAEGTLLAVAVSRASSSTVQILGVQQP
jgi:roadblock/LC7 domain-containing protein